MRANCSIRPLFNLVAPATQPHEQRPPDAQGDQRRVVGDRGIVQHEIDTRALHAGLRPQRLSRKDWQAAQVIPVTGNVTRASLVIGLRASITLAIPNLLLLD